ncbi:hypothetical protein M501DRAFT_1004377 [Patellaria atrata CBS 101060]|uniref:Uncharacterized protein n=1 Tax=Patellaria atrata CBS 101060 TaxID=1346257 RepID=A0A9P4VMG1_9PEZI|nr:hypothetical protein M501DRAFT_1004377 [Patellaria atrata CBS 101060]
MDGNSVEVVYREDAEQQNQLAAPAPSRVLTWREGVTDTLDDDRSTVSRSSIGTMKKALTLAGEARSLAPSVVKQEGVAGSVRSSKPPSVARSASSPVVPTMTTVVQSSSTFGDVTAKKIIGTLLGAAAGAAVAYAMVKGEEDGARAEQEYIASIKVKESSRAASQAPVQYQQQQLEAPPAAQQQQLQQYPQPTYESPSRVGVQHRNISETESYYSSPPQRQQYAIEAPPARSYHAPTYTTVPPTRVGGEAQSYYQYENSEYIPAASVTGHSQSPRSIYSGTRSVSSPSALNGGGHEYMTPPATPEKEPSLISSFVPEEETHSSTYSKPKSSSGRTSHSTIKAPKSTVSTSTKTSKAKSSHSSSSHKSDRSDKTATRKSSHERSQYTPSPLGASAPLTPSDASTPSKPPSIIGSVLGREASDYHSAVGGGIVLEEMDSSDDIDTVVPSDSISQAGSSRSHRSRRSHHSHHSSRSPTRSHHSSHSKAKSSASRHSGSSRHSSHSKSSRREREDEFEIEEYKSETGSTSTVKPIRRKEESRGTVVSLPIRGITPSMVEGNSAVGKNRRSVVSLAY